MPTFNASYDQANYSPEIESTQRQSHRHRMLNQDALAQLRQLKQDIHDSKDRAEGIVKGSQGRFGFVTLDDGREIYLPPEQMQRVFPDDRIAIEVITGPEGKPVAQLERVINSPLLSFTGRYVIRDNAHFVEPDLPRLSRWIFVPPKLRRPANKSVDAKPQNNKSSNKPTQNEQPRYSEQPKHGDWVRACITQHPFSDGKPQARIDAIIGSDNQKNIEVRYALARFDLTDKAPTLIESDLLQPDAQTYRDLTALPFITIDGAETRDMDDALHAEYLPTGDAAQWKLTVAIADPSAWIKPNSKLEQTIAARGTSAYLPGFCVPMLPEQLANDLCSLMPDAERFALVCEMWIDRDGHITRYEFSQARVRSQAKLSYDQAAEMLTTERPTTQTPAETPWADSLRALNDIGNCLQQQRQREHIMLPERSEYRAQINSDGKVANYQRQTKNAAHQLVEECMVATNRCAADYLQKDNSSHANADNAIFVCHAGFRSERHENVNKLIAAELPQLAEKNIADLADYIALMQSIVKSTSEFPVREILTRSFERSQFSLTAAPHFGMGLTCYTTITSPIRKFNDYLAHRAIKAKLRGEKPAKIGAEIIARLQDCSDRTRQAANFAQQWLDCDYMQKQIEPPQPQHDLQQDSPPQHKPQTHQATIVHVTSSGFLVRLNENGIQGFVDTRHTGEKFSFDSVYMRLSSATQNYLLDQQVEVKIASIDNKKHQIAMVLAATDTTVPTA